MQNQQNLEALKITMEKDVQKAEKDFHDLLLSSSTTFTSSNGSSIFNRKINGILVLTTKMMILMLVTIAVPMIC